MKRIYFLLIIYASYFNNVFSQGNIEIEISEGFVFFDYFGNEPEDFNHAFSGYGLQTEFDIWKNVYYSKSCNFKFGIGYTNYSYLYGYHFSFIARDEISTSYMNLKLGVNYKPKWSKIYFLINSTNYFLLYKEKQQYSQNRWFSNLDIGIRIKLFRNINISLWSPITLSPLHKGEFVARSIEFSKYSFDPWIGITGLNLGISYGFGN